VAEYWSCVQTFAAVLAHMVHGPCGTLHHHSPCMVEEDGRRVCGKGFPKHFIPCTKENDDGYPDYRRRDTGKMYHIGCAL